MPPGRIVAPERVLLLAPIGRDAELTHAALVRAGFEADICATIDDLCREMEKGAGAVLITEEALSSEATPRFAAALHRQPPWSDLPILLFTSRPSAEVVEQSFDAIGSANLTLIERPIRVQTLTTAAEAALRARRRQYEVRRLLDDQQRRILERDQFLAMLSHELRNPLAAITLALEGAAEESNGSGLPLDVLTRQSRHLRKLVDDLLDISRVTTGKITLHRTVVDVADIVEHTLSAFAPSIDARGLNVTFHGPPADKPALTNGDAVRLAQIANNLVSNAIKYTPAGGTVDVAVEADGRDVVLRVRDSGKGISDEMLTRIFDLFMQGDVTIDRSEGGMGIGLTLVQKLAELHGGSVRAYSRGPGSGSEFVVRLPRSEAPRKTAPKVSRVDGAKHHIVIVEDNRDVRDLLSIRLRHMGHRVDVAEDGVGGVELIVTAQPEVAIVDIGLPGLDGYGVANKVRERLGSSVYLVALTGYGQPEDRQKALEAGFDVHLTKPADIVDLQNVLASAKAGG